jgi:hypothetical protein
MILASVVVQLGILFVVWLRLHDPGVVVPQTPCNQCGSTHTVVCVPACIHTPATLLDGTTVLHTESILAAWAALYDTWSVPAYGCCLAS